MQAVIRTETWNTNKGQVVKAVARDERGKILGATNSTKTVGIFTLIGKR